MPRSRGPFNNLMNLYQQVAGVPLLVPYATDIPCRFVAQTQIAPQLYPNDQRLAWVTYDAAAPVPPTTSTLGSATLTEYGFSDRIEIASFPGILWAQLETEYVTPDGEAPYYRTWLGLAWY